MAPTGQPNESMGILQFEEARKHFDLQRYSPSPRLAPFVRHHWIVSWDLPGDTVFQQDLIPNPCVNLVAEHAGSCIFGPASRKYTKSLSGKGRAFGVKFKPGGFYPYYRQPLSGLRDGSLRVADLFDNDGSELAAALPAGASPQRLIGLAEALLADRLPEPDDTIALLNEMIDYAKDTREVTRVEQLCDAFGMGIRTMQRLFGLYVGVSPKWVIRLYRLQNAAELLDRGPAEDWNRFCLDFGYYDQAHFIKDFKSVIGRTPLSYTRPGINGGTNG